VDASLVGQHEKDGLKDILGVVNILQHAATEAKHPRTMPRQQGGESGLVTLGDEAFQQHGIAGHVRVWMRHQPVELSQQGFDRGSHERKPRGESARILPHGRPAASVRARIFSDAARSRLACRPLGQALERCFRLLRQTGLDGR
jgi:hypothetical protein